MAFPTTGILDDFNRADTGPPPSASWGGQIRTSEDGGLKVASNLCVPAVDSVCSGWWNDATFGPDSEVYATLVTVDPARVATFWVSISSPGTAGLDGYLLYAFPGTETIYRVDNEVLTALGASGTMTYTNGDSLGLDLVGGTITSHKKTGGVWSSILTRSDSTYTTGYVGFGMQGNGFSADDFGGGTAIVTANNQLAWIKA